MQKLLVTTAALLTFGATAALAELSTSEIADMFPGAQKIEIKRGFTKTNVEVTVGGEKIEVVFDNATNAELKRETRASAGADNSSDDSSADDESDDDHNGSGSDDGEDDDHGNSGSDDHGSDDHGSDDHGSDDGGDDDHGSDDGGDDDHGGDDGSDDN